MNLHKYDDLLSFDLPDDFHIINEVNDEGQPVFGIGIGKTVDDEGEDNYEYRLNISSQDESELGFDSSKLHLKGSVKNNVQFVRKSQSLLGMEFVFTVAFIFLIHEEKTYVLSSVLVGEGERQENWLSFVNKILSGVILEGQKGDFEIITEDLLNE